MAAIILAFVVAPVSLAPQRLTLLRSHAICTLYYYYTPANVDDVISFFLLSPPPRTTIRQSAKAAKLKQHDDCGDDEIQNQPPHQQTHPSTNNAPSFIAKILFHLNCAFRTFCVRCPTIYVKGCIPHCQSSTSGRC